MMEGKFFSLSLSFFLGKVLIRNTSFSSKLGDKPIFSTSEFSSHSLLVGCKEVQAVLKQSSRSITLCSLQLLFPVACDTVDYERKFKIYSDFTFGRIIVSLVQSILDYIIPSRIWYENPGQR